MKFGKTLLLIILVSFFTENYAQDKAHQVIPSISEIILPATTQTKDNFNLMYEVHTSRDTIPSPSFWYKIIFNDSCDFEFTLFPLNEEDRYEFFMYKIEGNENFCTARTKGKIITLNHFKYIKKYEDTHQSKKFRSNLINVKPIPVNPGDAIYLSVIAIKGRDCGHILDCRTTKSSMVIKVVNDNCSSIPPLDTLNYSIHKNKYALAQLSNELCLKKQQRIQITSIDLKGTTHKASKQLDYNSYSKKEALKYKKYQEKAEVNKTDAIPVKDLTPEVYPKVLPEPKTKTTADLNSATILNENQTAYQTKSNQKKTSRFKVDRVMFNLLLKDLIEKNKQIKSNLKTKYAELKKTKKKSKRKEKIKALKKVKNKKKLIAHEMSALKLKLKKIERSIRKENTEDFVFEGSLNDNKVIKSTPNGLIYKVQIGVYKNKIDNKTFKGLSPVYEDPYAGGVKYSVGAFKKIAYATQAKKHVVDLGLKDAFIVAYFNGNRISIHKAQEIE
jgi:hypothetical protein